MGYQATKYIGIPLAAKSRTTMYRDNWGANANSTTYKSTDVVMVTGNRTGKDTSNELLERHFRIEYLPLINAAITGKAKILIGADTGIDKMVREHLEHLGYELHLNSAGIYEAAYLPLEQIDRSIACYLPKPELERTTEVEEETELEMSMWN